MKKGFMNFSLATLIIAMFAFGFTACNSSSEGEEETTEEGQEEGTEEDSEEETSETSTGSNDAVVGVWVGESIEVNSPDMTEEEKEMMNSMMADMASMIEMTFNEDGTASMADPMSGNLNTGVYTMNADNSVMTLTDDASGETTDFSIVDLTSDHMVLEINEEGMGTITLSLVPSTAAASAE